MIKVQEASTGISQHHRHHSMPKWSESIGPIFSKNSSSLLRSAQQMVCWDVRREDRHCFWGVSKHLLVQGWVGEASSGIFQHLKHHSMPKWLESIGLICWIEPAMLAPLGIANDVLQHIRRDSHCSEVFQNTWLVHG